MAIMSFYSVLSLVATTSALPLLSLPLISPYSLPSNGLDQVVRATAITAKQATFLYGPAVAGGPSYPTGPLGLTYVTAAEAIVATDLAAQSVLVVNDSVTAAAHMSQYNGLKTLDDYTKLYDGIWGPSSAPTGQAPGMLTNYTQDLLFSMERLSTSPFAVARLDPSTNSSLPFTLDDIIVQNVTGQTLNSLFTSGQLFYIDYRAQGALPPSTQYAPACDAYFYISKSSGNFLPLAIRTNVGSNLIYTPADSLTDWLLAKIMFNTNDFFFSQFDHLARTHYVLDIVYQAAVRTLSDDHPVSAILARLMYSEFAMRPLASVILLPPGGQIDQFFGYSGAGAGTYATDLYNSGFSGAFQSNYFLTDLQRRGLINPSVGPKLKSFPYYEDAQPIFSAIQTFTTTFVNSYYPSDSSILSDPELQAWVVEANGPAKVIDFPSNLTSRSQLIDVLTNMAHLTSSAHHTVNLNQLLSASSVLPFHPSGLYSPVPTAKGVTDIVPFLPPIQKVIPLLMSQGNFARPLFAGTNRTLVNMFGDAGMLARMNAPTQAANQGFVEAMRERSKVVKGRGFGPDGLSQGMPFVWQALDPDVVPWSTSI